ncbi:MAG: STAS/SEC14 domain-containing protein [Chloroflexaceae bacterium]
MPYRITRHSEDLLWVVVEGHLAVDQANAYFNELWTLFDACTQPTDLLVDGRRISGASPGARRRMEQVAHHPRLGHLAFVVSEHHLLMFAPLVKMVSGIGLFGNEAEALDYLRSSRGLPPVIDLAMPGLPPRPDGTQPSEHRANTPPASADPQRPPVYSMPNGRAGRRQASGLFGGLNDVLDGWNNNLRNITRQIKGD